MQRNTKVRTYLGGPKSKAEADQAATAIVSAPPSALIWIVEVASTPIALVSLNPHKDGTDTELSYQFDPPAWGHGYATEALQEVLNYAHLALRLPRVIAETQTANTASLAVLHRLGMTQIATVNRFGHRQAIFATR